EHAPAIVGRQRDDVMEACGESREFRSHRLREQVPEQLDRNRCKRIVPVSDGQTIDTTTQRHQWRRPRAIVAERLERHRDEVEPHETGQIGVEVVTRIVERVHADVSWNEEIEVERRRAAAVETGEGERVSELDLLLIVGYELERGGAH